MAGLSLLQFIRDPCFVIADRYGCPVHCGDTEAWTVGDEDGAEGRHSWGTLSQQELPTIQVDWFGVAKFLSGIFLFYFS